MNYKTGQPLPWRRRFAEGIRILKSHFNNNKSKSVNEAQEEIQNLIDRLSTLQVDSYHGLVREYQTPEGNRVREAVPIIYGYSKIIGSNGKLEIREFGNVRPSKYGFSLKSSLEIESKRLTLDQEPLVDAMVTDNDVKFFLDIPHVKKENIKMNISENSIEVMSSYPERKFHVVIQLPAEVNKESINSKYNNGILEISAIKNNMI